MKKTLMLITALLLSAISYAQIDVQPTTFHNGVELPSISATGDTIHVKDAMSMEGNKITNLSSPDNEGDAVNKNYVDSQTASKEQGELAETALQPGDNVSELVNDAYIPNSEKAQPNGVSTLDGNGKIPTNQLPPVVITETFVVGSETTMLATGATQGDVAVRTDLDKNFILQTEPSTTLANWVELLSPNPPVQSVNGLAGTVSLDPIFSNGVLNITGSGGVTLDTRYYTKSEVDNSLNGKEDAFPKNSAFNKDFGVTSGTVAQGNDPRILHGETSYSWGDHSSYGLGTLSQTPYIDDGNLVYSNGFYGAGGVNAVNLPDKYSPMISMSRSGGISAKIMIGRPGNTGFWYQSLYNTDNTGWIELASQNWVESKNYLTSETDPVYSASTASGITAADVTNWDGKAEIADIPTDNAQLVNGAGYLTTSAFELIDTAPEEFPDSYIDKAIIVPALSSSGMTYSGGSIDFGINVDSIYRMGGYSFNVGVENKNMGTQSFTLGSVNTVTGSRNVAIGVGNIVSGFNGFASGYYNEVDGGFASGSSNKVDGGFAYGVRNTTSRGIAMGEENESSGSYSFAVGHSNISSSVQSITLGYSNTASGIRSIAMGKRNKSSGLISFAAGDTNTALGDISFVFGDHNTASSSNETVMGSYATIYNPTSATNIYNTDRLFVIGGGDRFARSDALLINKRGEVYAPSMTVEMIDTPHLETDDSHYATVPESNGKILVTKEYLMYWLKHLPSYDATKTQVLTNTSGTIGWTLK